MAPPAPLDIKALTAPVPGEDPAGGPIPFTVREQLEEARKEENPEDYPADDPRRPKEVKKADWPGIAKLAQDTLVTSSKDVQLAARLTEALARQHGFAGLRDGLRLLRELVEQCWDRLYPPIEDGDLEVRAGPFYWLDDEDRGARFPHTLRTLPVVATDKGQYGWLDWRQSQDGKGRVSRDEFEKTVVATPPAFCEKVGEDLKQSHEELANLVKALNARMGPAAPGMSALRKAVEDCSWLAQQISARKRPTPAAKTEKAGEGPAGAAATTRPATRADVYRQLSEAAKLLREIEPHSPIPYLIQRAVDLGAMSFPELMKELVRDAKILTDLNRELGIKEPPAPAKK